MRSFHATLNLHFDALNEEQALEIAKACKAAILAKGAQPWKVEVEIDDIEEN